MDVVLAKPLRDDTECLKQNEKVQISGLEGNSSETVNRDNTGGHHYNLAVSC